MWDWWIGAMLSPLIYYADFAPKQVQKLEYDTIAMLPTPDHSQSTLFYPHFLHQHHPSHNSRPHNFIEKVGNDLMGVSSKKVRECPKGYMVVRFLCLYGIWWVEGYLVFSVKCPRNVEKDILGWLDFSTCMLCLILCMCMCMLCDVCIHACM